MLIAFSVMLTRAPRSLENLENAGPWIQPPRLSSSESSWPMSLREIDCQGWGARLVWSSWRSPSDPDYRERSRRRPPYVGVTRGNCRGDEDGPRCPPLNSRYLGGLGMLWG